MIEECNANRLKRHDPIYLAKAILWEEAKGKLRALAAAGGAEYSAVQNKRAPDWEKTSNKIEEFIVDFESEGLNE